MMNTYHTCLSFGWRKGKGVVSYWQVATTQIYLIYRQTEPIDRIEAVLDLKLFPQASDLGGGLTTLRMDGVYIGA